MIDEIPSKAKQNHAKGLNLITGFYVIAWLFYLFMVIWTFYMLGVQRDYQQIIYPLLVWHFDYYVSYLYLLFLLWLMTVIGAFYVAIKQIDTKGIQAFYKLSAVLLLLGGMGLFLPAVTLVTNDRFYPEKNLKIQEINYLAVAHWIPDSGDYHLNYALYDCGRDLFTCNLLAEYPLYLPFVTQVSSFEYNAETNSLIITWHETSSATDGMISYSLAE